MKRNMRYLYLKDVLQKEQLDDYEAGNLVLDESDLEQLKMSFSKHKMQKINLSKQIIV